LEARHAETGIRGGNTFPARCHDIGSRAKTATLNKRHTGHWQLINHLQQLFDPNKPV